ncbi:MAG: hypothetical protein ACI9Y1_002013, partial [Lentisphaeria bacterium]
QGGQEYIEENEAAGQRYTSSLGLSENDEEYTEGL